MNLSEKPDSVTWPSKHYVFVEKTGPFMQTARSAWESAHKLVPTLANQGRIKGHMSLYKMKPEMVYRAGFELDTAPKELPEGLRYELVPGGAYARFVLKGSYSELPAACGRVFEIVEKTKMAVRPAFNVENYVTDPKTTPSDQNVIEILIPTA